MSNNLKNVLEKEDGEKFTVSYFLTHCDGENDMPEYGVGIRIEETGEEGRVDSISPVKGKAEDLLELCFKNCVTPTTLLDVAYDYICS